MIEVEHITKVYRNGQVETVALTDVSFKIERGEFIAIMGPSGSGKSTLMHILGCLEVPTAGTYILDGKEVGRLADDELAAIRNKKIGFVFQSYNLLPRLTTLRNVMLPMAYGGIPRAERVVRAKELLDRIGLGDRLEHKPSQLSGGQQQRVAIARALAMNPPVILADEPTGNLATAQSEQIMAIFQELNRQGHTIIVVTHDPNIAAYAKRIIYIRDGRVSADNGAQTGG
ncbi:MAG: ABC transporter ATP-binding protein [Bacillota bacterium]